MKKSARLLVLAVLAMILLSVSAAALADDITAYIPGRVSRLDLPGYENAVYDEYQYKGDAFRTGQDGAKTTVFWEEVKVKGYKYVYRNGVKIKKNAKYDTLYIPRVITTYPKGNYIRQIVANFRNDEAGSLIDYLITYQVSESEKYTVRYAAADAAILETHEYRTPSVSSTADASPTGSVKITFSKWKGEKATSTATTKQFIHRYYQDQILEGWYDADGEMTLKSGSGDNFKKWYRWEYWTGKVVEVRKRGLKPVTAFKSPRVLY